MLRNLCGRVERLSFPLKRPFTTSQLNSPPSNAEIKLQLGAVLNQFHAPIRFAFAYGSGALKQQGYTHTLLNEKDSPMIDFVFGVTYPDHWHDINIHQNPHHYSSLRRLGSQFVKELQDKTGGRIYYNPYVKVNGLTIKYGVISLDALRDDLTDWQTMYLAGRMQKPVLMLRDDSRVRLALQTNLSNALRVALLMLSERFSEQQLFEVIAGLSYKGDFRMWFGENSNKVVNIVSTQMDSFRDLYAGDILREPAVQYLNDHFLEQDKSIESQAAILSQLPPSILDRVVGYHYRNRVSRGIGDTFFREDLMKQCTEIVSSPNLARYLNHAIVSIIRKPAFTQAAKGLFSAGVTKSVCYTSCKLKKAMFGK